MDAAPSSTRRHRRRSRLELAGATCVVTGASSGIGREIAIALGQRGARLVLVARRGPELAAVLEQAGGNGRVHVCDIGVRTEVAALVRSIEEIEGSCHVLVNNAGIGARVEFGPDTLDVLERVMATNFLGAAWATAMLLPLLRASAPARVINISSIAGFAGIPKAAIYCASKFALTGMSESLDGSLRRDGIRVINLQPGPVPTPGFPHEQLARSWYGRPLWTTAEAIARVAVRAAEHGRPAWPVRPRIYRLLPALKYVAPGAYRALLGMALGRRVMPPESLP